MLLDDPFLEIVLRVVEQIGCQAVVTADPNLAHMADLGVIGGRADTTLIGVEHLDPDLCTSGQ